MTFHKVRNEKGKLVPDKSRIIYNDHITIENIPAKAYEYIVNDRNTWKRFLKVSCEAFMVLWRMQDTIDIIEDMFFSDSFGIAEAFTYFF